MPLTAGLDLAESILAIFVPVWQDEFRRKGLPPMLGNVVFLRHEVLDLIEQLLGGASPVAVVDAIAGEAERRVRHALAVWHR